MSNLSVEKATLAPAAAAQASSAMAFKVAWVVALIFYFFEYVVRAAPAVMLPELQTRFAVDALGISAIISSYYYTYSVASLVAGLTLDKFGARAPVAIGVALMGIGSLLFIVPVPAVGELGRLLQGAGSAFAFTGAVYLATHGFSGSALATAIGFTQCFGMLGGSAGQIIVGPAIHNLLSVEGFWIFITAVCFLIAAALLIATPSETHLKSKTAGLLAPFKTVFSNPQSYLCGIIAGLLFTPTTVGDMIWGVAFYQQDRSLDYIHAVTVVAMVPLGWAIGCPLVGWIADFTGRRKFALMLGAVLMLASVVLVALVPSLFVSHIGMLLLGIGSGAAMIPYAIIKEVNPDDAKGSAIGVINFLTFSVTALIGPIFAHLIGAGLTSAPDHLRHFREGAWFWATAIILALILSYFLRETGTKRLKSV